MNRLEKSLPGSLNRLPVDLGHFILRVAVGLMVFYIHGLHKLLGGIAFLRHGTAWPLVEDVTQMHLPAPVASAFAATLVQFVCSLFLVAGFYTRLNALLLVGALSGAILQNLLSGRDPQLAILYTLVVVVLVFMGGGKYSLDARLSGAVRPAGRGTPAPTQS